MTEGDSGHQEGPDEEAGRAKVVAGDGASPGRTTGTRVATSAFRGVCWHRKSRRWQSAINSSGRHVYLGSFDSEEEAARMFDKVAIRVRGMKAKLNFPYEDYLGPDGQLLTDPKLEQLVNEAHKALLEKQRWQVADDDDARAGGGGSNKRRRLGAAAPAAAGVGLPQRGCVDLFPGEDMGPHPHQHPHGPRGELMPGPAFGFGLGLGADPGLYGAAGSDADALGVMTGIAGGLKGPISNFPEGLMDPASSALRSLLALQQPEGPRALLPPQKQQGTGMLLQPGFVGGGGSVTAAAAVGALRATGLRDPHGGDMADAVAAAAVAATAGHVGGRLLDLAGMAGGGGDGGSERGMGPADHVHARGAHGLGLRLDGADACGMMQQQGQPPLPPPSPHHHHHHHHQQQQQQQQLVRQLIPRLPGPRRSNVLEGVTLTASAAAMMAVGNPRLDVSAGLAAGQYAAPKPGGGGGGDGAAADASELDGFCLDLRKGPAAGGGSRADHPLGSPVEAAATAVAADGAPFLRLGYAAPEAAAATLGTVHPSRRLMGGATAEPPAASPPKARSDLDLTQLIGRFLAGVRCHLPAGTEIESLIPCADGSLLGYTFVRVLGGPGAPAAPAPAQQTGCSSSGSSGDRGAGHGAGRDDRGPDGDMKVDGAGGGARCEAPRELGPAAGHHPRGRSDRSSGSGSSGASPEDIPGGVGGGSGPDANGRPGTGAGIFFRGMYRDLGAYSTAQDAIQACKACMTVVLELKEALMAEAVAEALSRSGGGGGAAIAAPAPPPPLPPQPPPSWGREEGADGAAAAARPWRQLPLPVGPRPPPQGPPSPPQPHQPASEPLQQQQGQQQGQQHQLLLSSQEPTAAVEDQKRFSSALEQLQQLLRQLARHQQGEAQPQRKQQQGQQPQATPGAASAAQLGPHATGALWKRHPLADTCGQRNDHDDEEEPHKSCESSQADGTRLWQPQTRPRPPHPPLTSTVRVAADEGLGRLRKPEETEQKVSAQREQEQQQQQQPGGARQPPAQAPPDVLGPAPEPRVAARALASSPQALEALAEVVARLLSGSNARDSVQDRRSPLQERRPEQTPPPSQQHQQQQQLRQILRQGLGYEQWRPPPLPHPQQQQQQQRQGKQQPVFTSPPVLAEPGHRAALQLHALQNHAAQASNCDHGAGSGVTSSCRLGFGACDIGGGAAGAGASGVLQALLANFSGFAALAGGNPDLLAAAAATVAAKAAAATAAADNDDAIGRCTRNPSGSCDSTDDAPPPLPPPGLGRRQPPPPPSPGTGRAGHSNASSSDVRAMKGGAPAWEGRSCGGGGAANTPEGDGSGGDAVAWQRREDSRLTWSRGPGAASLSSAAAAAVAGVAAPPLRAEADGARTGLYGGGHGQQPISRQPFHRLSSFHSQYSQYDNGHADVSESYGLGELTSRR